MRRTQMYLDEALHRRITRAARAEGRSAASLIREAAQRYLDARAPRDDDPLRALIGASRGGRRDAARDHDRYLYREDK